MAYNGGGQQSGIDTAVQLAERSAATMLVLSRKLGEKIIIGDNITITVIDIDRGKIRLGIEAPRNIPVYRQELLTNATQQPAGSNAPAAPPSVSLPSQ
jgi:carbon storage regulator